MEAELDSYGTKRFYVYDEVLVERFKAGVWSPSGIDVLVVERGQADVAKHKVNWQAIGPVDEEPGDRDVDRVASYISTLLLSDLFAKDPLDIARKIVEYRERDDEDHLDSDYQEV